MLGGLNPLLWSQVARTSFEAASVLTLFIGGRSNPFSSTNGLIALQLRIFRHLYLRPLNQVARTNSGHCRWIYPAHSYA